MKDHPVMRQLLELRYAMEKMRPLDAKLQYQIDRLLKVRNSGMWVLRTTLHVWLTTMICLLSFGLSDGRARCHRGRC